MTLAMRPLSSRVKPTARVHLQLCAQLLRVGGHRLPELAGAVFGIAEPLDQRGFHPAVFFAEGFGDRAGEDLHQRKPLDPLRAPIRRNLARMHAPEVFRVMLKKHLIERAAELVDVEIFQRGDGQLVHPRRQIAETGFHRARKTHVDERLRFDRNRIIEKLLQIVDARNAVTREHHPVFPLRVGAADGKRNVAREHAVVHRRRSLHRHDLLPKRVDLLVLGEEAVAAQVDAASVVANRAGNAADFAAFFQQNDAQLVSALLFEIVGGGEPRRACTDDDNCFHGFCSFLS